MKKAPLLLFFAALAGTPAGAEPPAMAVLQGSWIGKLEVGGATLRIVFNVETGQSWATATMDSPDQGARGIPVASVTLNGSDIVFDVKRIGGNFEGSIEADAGRISGFWKQGGAKLPLVLEKVHNSTKGPSVTAGPGNPVRMNRPQEPKPPFSYPTREVTVESAGGLRLSGTLCLPEGQGPFPAAFLVTGSGQQDRDETIFSHKPFLVIADYLARRGIATLRLDDRGAGGSGGDFAAATTFDFADDAEAAIGFLRRDPSIAPAKVGVIGHSEGGLVAAIVASRDSGLGFVILLAGPGLSGEKLLYLQNAAIGRASGLSEEAIQAANATNASLYAIALGTEGKATQTSRIIEVFRGMAPPGASPDVVASMEANGARAADQLLSPWFRTFLALDPYPYLAKVKLPLLAMTGSKDLQVPAEPNLAAIGAAMAEAGNGRYSALELAGLNHLFQTAGSGLPAEYANIEETFAPAALEKLGGWIADIVR